MKIISIGCSTKSSNSSMTFGNSKLQYAIAQAEKNISKIINDDLRSSRYRVKYKPKNKPTKVKNK